MICEVFGTLSNFDKFPGIFVFGNVANKAKKY